MKIWDRVRIITGECSGRLGTVAWTYDANVAMSQLFQVDPDDIIVMVDGEPGTITTTEAPGRGGQGGSVQKFKATAVKLAMGPECGK